MFYKAGVFMTDILLKDNFLNGVNGKIKNFKIVSEKVEKFSLLEFQVDMPIMDTGVNVYNSNNVRFAFEMDDTIHTDAFYFEEYAFDDDLTLQNRTEQSPCFRIRVTPQNAGISAFKLSLFINNELADMLNGNIEIENSNKSSKILSVEPKRKQVFISKDAVCVPLIGGNMSYFSGYEDTISYAKEITEKMKKLAQNGVNHVRFIDNMKNGVSLRKGVLQMRQETSALWDAIFKCAEELGIYITFVFADASEIPMKDSPSFKNEMWHQDNGGFITDATEFFEDENTINAFLEYVRYVISRYGYSEQVLTWEIFNEIDRCGAMWRGKLDEIKSWLTKVIDYIKLTDSYAHPVSCSILIINLMTAFHKLFDILSYQCDQSGHGMLIEMQNNSRRAFNKPVVIGNSGVSGYRTKWSGGAFTSDLFDLNQNNWVGLMGGGAGTCLNKNSNEIYENNSEWCFKAISDFSKQIPFDDVNMITVTEESIKTTHNRISLMGYCGMDYAYLWLYDNFLWSVAREDEISFENEEILELRVSDGNYLVKWIESLTGDLLYTEKITVSNKKTKIAMPKWSKDVAVAINRV